MSDVTLAHAKEHLEEILERAARGKQVRIVAPASGSVRLTPDVAATGDSKPSPPWDLTAPRLTDTMPKFVPLAKPRVLGHLKRVPRHPRASLIP